MTTAQTERSELDEDEGWRAIEARDARYDGAFVFGVRTTGIYCRPGCPARRPRRENIVFFAAPDEARREGFRSCLRCKPDESSARLRMVERATRYLDEHANRTVTLAELGEAVGVSPHHLQRTFKQATGVSPRAWADQRRMGAFKTQVKDRDDVTSAMYDAGFGSSSRLYERASAHLGMTPDIYRRGGRGMRVGYSIVDSPLGRLLVGATGRGICAVYLGDDDDNLEETLSREYPAAAIHRDDTGLNGWVRAIVDHLRGARPHLDLPLDVQATAFQRRVWEALQAIPFGATRSYGEVARMLGQPEAARAVAGACASNPVAIVVPCHRVVRGDGSPGGYRWGTERKQALLSQERSVAAVSRRSA
ncbi:MAG TPA: bifunctional DNA-binding transcriptional regulator/O6-methylguanine-DNA methyltransferase Ada [Thermomicrobiales bacterium]|nr:bifunctional DNA-binding transcriptional regulator/O6-methylguanine-DNA methyltransferase Ada [Thermomicrobiales bacterium]